AGATMDQAGAPGQPGAGQDGGQDERQPQGDAQQGGFCHGKSAPAVEPVDAFGRRDDVGQSDAVAVFDHHDFALRDQVAVDVDVHGLAGKVVQLDDRALAELQQVLDGQAGAAELHRELDRDVHDQV